MTETYHGALVAQNIRRLRDRQGLSLSSLARRAGIAKATLSAIENAEGNPTIATLQSLASALRVPVARLVGSHEAEGAHLVRGAGGRSGTDDVPIDSFLPDGIVELYDVRYETGDDITFEAHQAGVVERVFVQTGSLRVGPTDATEVLEAGDYLAYPADRSHRVAVIGEGPVRGTLVVSYPVTAPSDSPLHGRTR